jgi:isopropylmalate/isohomocitrate dehydrogenase-like protein
MVYRIAVLPGDGIGPEVIESAVSVLDATGIRFDFEYSDIGYGCYKSKGQSLPKETIDNIIESDAALFGAVTTPTGLQRYQSPIIGLRKHLQLYANVRPSKSWPHINGKPIDMVIIRENTECLYSGIERVEDDGKRAVTERIITRDASERIIRYAFEYARSNNRAEVNCVHKANVMRATCGLFLNTFNEIAQEYPDIKSTGTIVDAAAMRIVETPEKLDVIVTTNMFGDILSDVAAAKTGGIGLAASGNYGDSHSVFEPVHGSAPMIAGRGIANPIGTIMAGAMMLDYLSEKDMAERIRNAVNDAICNNEMPQDMGGKLNTNQTENAIIERMKWGK